MDGTRTWCGTQLQRCFQPSRFMGAVEEFTATLGPCHLPCRPRARGGKCETLAGSFSGGCRPGEWQASESVGWQSGIRGRVRCRVRRNGIVENRPRRSSSNSSRPVSKDRPPSSPTGCNSMPTCRTCSGPISSNSTSTTANSAARPSPSPTTPASPPNGSPRRCTPLTSNRPTNRPRFPNRHPPAIPRPALATKTTPPSPGRSTAFGSKNAWDKGGLARSTWPTTPGSTAWWRSRFPTHLPSAYCATTG